MAQEGRLPCPDVLQQVAVGAVADADGRRGGRDRVVGGRQVVGFDETEPSRPQLHFYSRLRVSFWHSRTGWGKKRASSVPAELCLCQLRPKEDHMGVGPQVHSSRWRAIAAICAVTVTSLFGVVGTGGLVTAATGQTPSSYTPPATGELDCNGFSPVQKPLRPMLCTDIRGDSAIDNSNTWGGRFYDNGHYIGHDEPDATFLSNHPGSGGDVTWTLTIGRDPALAPTDANPGHDVSHWFELSPAPWFSMALCDPNSFPQAPVHAELGLERPHLLRTELH